MLELSSADGAFELSEARAHLEDVDAVVHCAGPFAHTSTAMVDACLKTRTHYLDITGEIDVFESVGLRDIDARKAGIVLLPGAGFDVADIRDVRAIHPRMPAADPVLALRGHDDGSHPIILPRQAVKIRVIYERA